MKQTGKTSGTALYRLPFSFDTARLRADLGATDAAAWNAHYKAYHFDGDWSALALVSRSGAIDDLKAGDATETFQPTALLEQAAYIRDEVLPTFKCPLRRVRFMRLSAGSEVRRHIDYYTPLKSEVRIHVPIVTNERVTFFAGAETAHLAAGECWYLDVNAPHAVVNHGAEDRVHLVIDCEVNDWMRGVLPNPWHVESPIWTASFYATAAKYAWRDARERAAEEGGSALGIVAHQFAYDMARRTGIVAAKRMMTRGASGGQPR